MGFDHRLTRGANASFARRLTSRWWPSPNSRLHRTRTAALLFSESLTSSRAVRAGEPQVRWATRPMRRILILAIVVGAACGQPTETGPVRSPSQPDRLRELVEFDPTMEQLRPNPKPDAILIGCMDVSLSGNRSERQPLPKRIKLTRDEVQGNPASVQTWYAVESLDPAVPQDEGWIWLPLENMRATVLMGNGFVGWEMKLGPAPEGFQGTVAWYSDAAPFRGESAAVTLRRTLCN